MGLGDVDSRRIPAGVNDRLNRIERRIEQLASTARLLRNGFFADGSIPTDALVSPAAPGLLNALASGFTLTATGGVLLEQTFTVPDRMRAAVVYSIARVYAVNGSGAAGALLVRAEVGAFAGTALPVGVGNGAGGVSVSPLPALLTGLEPGQEVTARVWAQASNATWPADLANRAELTGTVSWFA